MLVETCLFNIDIKGVLDSLGYNAYLLESKVKVKDITLNDVRMRKTFLHEREFNRYFSKNSNTIYFVKPSSRSAIIKALNDPRVNGISVDNSNYKLVKKNLLNLSISNKKYLEIILNSSSSEVIRRAIEWGYRGARTIFSICVEKVSDIWSPLSVFNYLILHGASPSYVASWLFTYPSELFINGTNVY
ncbi:hypothetical protein GWK48_05515 [Metallosphaera tengchongensis]|uniref:RNase P subunit p30 n=1 Tax=Metallosphaera tengchongensis TaxID=1532350 RepID=A0A6N0NST2_9CREN|nr:hypothetical protein [Metallosphaera tengchongensis]QKQ99903.1 hypothetical protein GWK48_05515 [Metallosphaera tengchongensis]